MSRIGKLPVAIPAGVQVKIDGSRIVIEGPKGKLEHTLPPGIAAQVEEKTLRVQRTAEGRDLRALHGMSRKLVANMVTGVSEGFSEKLEIIGVGYRAEVRGKDVLFLTLGYSHPIIYQLPEGVTAKVDRQVAITLESRDRQLLGQVAARPRLRGPEHFKRAGGHHAEEHIRAQRKGPLGAAGSRTT
jgi:large subunit ribosomal protein L6